MTARSERNPEVVTLHRRPGQKARDEQAQDEQRGRFFARVRHADANLGARRKSWSGFAPPTSVPARTASCCSSSITSSTCTRGCAKSPRTWCHPRTGAPGRSCSPFRRWHSSKGGRFSMTCARSGSIRMDSVSLTPLPQTIALAAYAHYQLVERATVGLVGYLWFFERMPRLFYPLWSDVMPARRRPRKGAARAGAKAPSSTRRAISRWRIAAGRSCAGRAISVSRRRACTTPRSCSRPWSTRPCSAPSGATAGAG